MRVLLDANFLRIPFQFGVDIFSELERALVGEPTYELATISLVKGEVEKMAQTSQEWVAVFELISIKNIKVYQIEATDTDAGLLEFAQPGDILCTQDRELKLRAKSKNIRVITMVNKSHLEEV